MQWCVTFAAWAQWGVALAVPLSVASPRSDGPVTDSDSEVRELGKGVTLVIAPGSMVSDAGTLSLPARDQVGGRVPAVAFNLDRGRVDVIIGAEAAGKQAIVVRGPRRTTAVTRRGHSSMAVVDHRVAVAAYQGAVTISAGSGWSTLVSGRRWVVEPRFPSGHTLPLIAAPTVSLRTPIHIATSGSVGQVRVVVKPSPNAVAYSVAAIPSAGTHGAARRFISTKTDILLRGLSPGAYSLQARAIDAFGLEGTAAPLVPLRVVGVQLPPGAYCRNGTPYLTGRQALAFTHAEGLELTYDSGDYFIPVPPTVGLRRGRPVRVRLREPGSEIEAELLLEPRQFESSIEIGPANAIWPKDAVHIRVDVSEFAQGGEDWPTLNVRLRTTLNNEMLAPEWLCRDTSCRTVIRAPGTPGPWVLRVEMHDDQGLLVGRNFMEIAEGSLP